MRRASLQCWLLVGLLSACATTEKTSVPKMSTDLEGKGLVMARFAIPGRGYMEGDEITISGERHRNALRSGQLVLALAPGEYEVENLRSSPGGSYIYTVPYKRKFQIEAGATTNLGLIVALTDRKEKDKFSTVVIDNNREMLRYLRANYPALADRFKPEQMKLAPGSYVERAKIQALRREIALREVGPESPQRRPAYRVGDVQFIAGDAGTIVSFPIKDGKLGAPTIHDTGTLAEIPLAARFEDRLAFLSDSGELFMVEGAGLRRIEVPYPVNPAKFRLLGRDTIVIVDQDMRVYSTLDGGRNWSRFESAGARRPTASYNFENSSRGLYIYREMTGVPDALLYGRSPYAQFEPIAPPGPDSSLRGFNKLTAADSGLFIDYGSPKFHFRPHDAGVWQLRSKPSALCFGRLEFPDASGRRILIKCGENRFESTDSGGNWKAI